MYNYNLLISLLETFDKSIYSKRVFEGDFLKSKEYNYIKQASIEKLNNEDKIDESYLKKINNFIKNNKEMELPFEALILICEEFNDHISEVRGIVDNGSAYDVKDFNNYDLFKRLCNNIKEYNNIMLDIIYNKNFYNISPEILKINYMKIYKYSSGKFNTNYYLNIITNKLKLMRKIHIDNEDSKKSIILKYKIKNTKNYEIIEYLNEYDNYVFTLDMNIKFLELETGKQLLKLEKINISTNSYYEMFRSLFENIHQDYKNIIIENNLYRLIFYKSVDEIKNNEIYIRPKEDIKEFILSKKELFEEEYFDYVIEKLNPEQTRLSNYLKELKNNPTNECLENIIKKCSSAYDIFYIMTSAEKIINRISNGNYVASILKADKNLNKNDNESIRYSLALYIEELITRKPLIIKENIEILKEIYNSNIFTENTISAIRYISHSVDNEEIIERASLIIKSENNEFDNNLLETIYKRYRRDMAIDLLDEILNKIIYNVDDFSKIFKDKIILKELVYYFYKKYNDINALKKLVLYIIKNNEGLKENGIVVEDLKKISDFIIELDEISNLKKLEIFEEYKEDKFIFGKIRFIIESIYDLNDKDEIDELNKSYSEFIKILRNESEKLYKYYINSINNEQSISELSDKDIIEIEKKLNVKILNTIIKEKITIILIIYYINNKNEEKLKFYINQHIEKYTSKNTELFNRIIQKCDNDIWAIELILKNIDFFTIEGGEVFLEDMFNLLDKNSRLDLADEILDYYIANNKEILAVEMLKKYLKSNANIHEFTYEKTVIKILEAMSNKEEEKNIYFLMSERDDLPIEIREHYYSVYYLERDKQKIIESFLIGETLSQIAINLTAEKNFNNDEKFKNIICSLENIEDEDLIELIIRKIREKFASKEGKHYLYDILSEIETENEYINKINEYLNSYFDYTFDISNQKIFGEYVVSKEDKGEFIRKVNLKNIFNNLNIKEGFIITDNSVRNILVKYFDENEVCYEDSEKVVYIINENNDIDFIKNGGIEIFINNLVKLIKLQKRLITSGAMIIKFDNESFIINSKGFIINSPYALSEYKDGLKVKVEESTNTEILKLRNGRYITLNEENLCKIIQIQTKEILNHIEIEDDIDSMRIKFIETVLKANINTYDLFLTEISSFLYNEKKKFEQLAFLEKLNGFYEFEIEDKKSVVMMILDKLDTTSKSKSIMLSVINDFDDYQFDEKIKKLYLLYIIECFNEYYMGLNEDNLLDIYEFLIANMDLIINDILEKERSIIENFYIKASEKTGIAKQEIKNDVRDLDITDEEKEYIIERI